jgi:EAL domain-containing protein (putative c-di-GMP-specific phosphodiesterase class I)
MPVSEIKIDRSFVMNMDTDEDDATIVRCTIDLGRNLGLDVVAEGVETEQTWNRLKDLGCTTGQGYYLSRAVPAAELEAWLLERRKSRRVLDHALPPGASDHPSPLAITTGPGGRPRQTAGG